MARFARSRLPGEITWTPTSNGPFDLTLRVENDVGAAEQTFTVHVEDPSADAGVADDAGVGPNSSGADAGPDDSDPDDCSCSVARCSSFS